MGEESLLRILFMLIVYRGLPRDECDEILTSRRFFHTGFYTPHGNLLALGAGVFSSFYRNHDVKLV
jgi:hypothetical protein